LTALVIGIRSSIDLPLGRDGRIGDHHIGHGHISDDSSGPFTDQIFTGQKNDRDGLFYWSNISGLISRHCPSVPLPANLTHAGYTYLPVLRRWMAGRELHRPTVQGSDVAVPAAGGGWRAVNGTAASFRLVSA
jgi:hypothetical protein